MIRFPWKPGLLCTSIGPYYVSATRFTYRDTVSWLRVMCNGLLLRAAWPRVYGAIGLSTMVDYSTRSAYTLSVWSSYADLQTWVRSEGHARLMKAYRASLIDVAYEGWTAATFDLAVSWKHAMSRIRA